MQRSVAATVNWNKEIPFSDEFVRNLSFMK